MNEAFTPSITILNVTSGRQKLVERSKKPNRRCLSMPAEDFCRAEPFGIFELVAVHLIEKIEKGSKQLQESSA